MKAYNGFSTNANPKMAGVEAAKMAGGKDAKVVFAYMSCDYDVKKVIEGLKTVYSCPIIGNTSFTGVVLPNGFVTGDKGFVGIMAVCGSDVNVGVGCVAKTDASQDAIALGEKAAKLAMKSAGEECAPKAMYMVGSPTEECFYLKGIEKVVGRIPFFGGSAADNTIAGNWSLYADNKVT
ncbi:MAG: hypothetical protein MJ152_05110, partial [Clostridia bacterium]|nr:hypothetical protein [Clostridia bacterium]